MDYNQYQSNTNQKNEYRKPEFNNPGLTMASVSLFLGVGVFLTMLTVFLPLILGGFAILFALLSKGYNKKMLPQAKIGFGCGIAGLAVVVCLFVSSYTMLFSNPELLVEIGQQYDAAYEEMYGHTTEEDLGISFEDMMDDYADMLQ